MWLFVFLLFVVGGILLYTTTSQAFVFWVVGCCRVCLPALFCSPASTKIWLTGIFDGKLLFVDSHIMIYPTERCYYCGKPLNLVWIICSQFVGSGVGMLGFFREKSWTVRLVNGYILDNQVRADQCRDCDSNTKLVVSSNSDPDLLLYGCKGHKCKHILIRVKFPEENQTPLTLAPLTVRSTVANFQEITQTVWFGAATSQTPFFIGRMYQFVITKL